MGSLKERKRLQLNIVSSSRKEDDIYKMHVEYQSHDCGIYKDIYNDKVNIMSIVCLIFV